MELVNDLTFQPGKKGARLMLTVQKGAITKSIV